MILATLTSKGQVTIPLEVRTRLQIKAGDQIAFEALETGGFVVKPAQFVPASSVKGLLQATKLGAGKSLTIDEINTVIKKSGAATK